MQHRYCNIPYMFDYWVNPDVHLLLPIKELHGLLKPMDESFFENQCRCRNRKRHLTGLSKKIRLCYEQKYFYQFSLNTTNCTNVQSFKLPFNFCNYESRKLLFRKEKKRTGHYKALRCVGFVDEYMLYSLWHWNTL